MEKVSFPIYEPQKQPFRLTPNWIVAGLFILTITFFYVFNDYFSSRSEFRSDWLFLLVLITIGFLITSLFRYEPLNGIINGEIVFEESRIIVNEKVYELKNIKGIDFSFVNFYGERSIFARDFNPKLYQGVDNYISFTDNINQIQKIYFRQLAKNHYKELYPFINEAVRVGAMTYYRAIDLIDVENVTKP
jgi:hypothetical protein